MDLVFNSDLIQLELIVPSGGAVSWRRPPTRPRLCFALARCSGVAAAADAI